METAEKHYRMYCLAERHLSSIQKAIQSAHAVVEYSLKYGDTFEYKKWAEVDKTLIVLDGGCVPDLSEHAEILTQFNYPFAVFKEPDLDDILTCVCFIADDRIYDYKNWGTSFDNFVELVRPAEVNYNDWLDAIGGPKAEAVKMLISNLRIAI